MSPVEPYAGLRWPSEITGRAAKQSLAEAAALTVRTLLDDVGSASPRVGLGSGSTAFLTLLTLASDRALLASGLVLVATSYEMEWYASAAGFRVVPLDDRGVDVAFDGADQWDPDGALVKGRGGAMHRERAVLDAARHQLIVADRTKQVAVLGGCPLPLDLDPHGIIDTVRTLESAVDAPVRLRSGTGKDGPVLSESGGILADLALAEDRPITAELDAQLRRVPGVRETGYFAPSPVRRLISG